MTVNNDKHDHMVAQPEPAVPCVVSLPEQINMAPGPWYGAIGLANAFSALLIFKDHQKQFSFTWLGQQYTFTMLPSHYVNSPALCHNIVHRDLYYVFSLFVTYASK